MENSTNIAVSQVITPAELLAHWQGHRRVTRRTIEAFPEDAFFNHTIGGMRPFANMVMELLAIGVPGLKEIVEGKREAFNEDFKHDNKKATFLKLWDDTTDAINTYWAQLKPEQFQENVILFGQYEGTVWSQIFYFIENEIHHRAQGYVYLRALGIEPPLFYVRD
ncbi:damage-inducible protein DinB [Winogradskyella echinorum]|uniref:Damage-inducible protein DinB n=1 Tax=Winogradskyella echinorum TaxID=538189 RepID=A0ABR6Y167_9FLAO|nr:DinB family protein [Winogradskyella echinorum]MBC3846482.1 damage-inducible protein DinB [Winogradskyella echinorum]MBC5750830.1 damage-inducible protein DinB [Winogradskyella echinorum]